MNEGETRELEATAVRAVALQLNEAMEEGRHQGRKLSRQIQFEVDQLVRFGPSHLPVPSVLVILAVLVVGGTAGFLWAVADRNWATCALFVVLMALGVFLLDQVRLLQRREDALKAGLYAAATKQNPLDVDESAPGEAEH
ncbi:hypothetical protein [Nocardia sp. NRRL S-836]|uniref:hypothetical protein n=1 Tax=Nocardia sp. NRRL S-836 TaxID=1519492 RepID=UPI0006C2D8AF|nr:hypothetical protein [Nocardia sp. NRRL S-836]KOV87532.1 hypothetical protein ADL03_06330 [Nocardia sp. NRRL S-836]